MIYQIFLNKIYKDHTCPFCNLNKKLIIKENYYAILTIARAPYIKDHLLVFPKRHVIKLHNLRYKEQVGIGKLILFGMNHLHKIYPGVEVSYKEGDDLISAGKSINHMHVHLVPKKKVVHMNQVEDKRNFYPEKKVLTEVNKLKKLFG